ncbi:uncharacterized protein LOC116199284 isoform X3 [Punica granatum]|uniref:Uncharacterized protein LOC116199284 isoform X3 n=1 Tax=Punica granatum TaxID=22663 RepID=A0A6P8CTG0_PUNGR|nr:uncharacterized protein LOC116199284 isoform X3 [Punica granatum]
MSTDKGYGQPFAPRLVSTAMGTKEKAEVLLYIYRMPSGEHNIPTWRKRVSGERMFTLLYQIYHQFSLQGLLEHTVIAICDSPTPMASPGTGRDQQLRPTCYKQVKPLATFSQSQGLLSGDAGTT